MRCPQCGLVHADADQFCRRCQVDLRTGQPRPRETVSNAAAAEPAWQQLLGFVRPLLARVQLPRRAPSRPPAAPTGPLPAPAPAGAPARPQEAPVPRLSKLTSALRQIQNPLPRLLSRIQAARAARSGLKTLTCIQCSGVMHIERASAYGAGGPLALILLGAVVFVLGRWAWPLFLLGPAGLGLGVFYRRRGASFWHCRGCGYRIPRQG